MVILALPSGVFTVSRLSPLLRPVTRPWKRPLGRTANMLLISAPLRATLTPNAGFTAGGRLICTNASPPETRSARLERIWIVGPPVCAFAGARPNASIAHRDSVHKVEVNPGPAWNVSLAVRRVTQFSSETTLRRRAARKVFTQYSSLAA